MAITYTNIWYTKILTVLRNVIRAEFRGIPVYISKEEGKRSNVYIEIDAVSQVLVNTSSASFTNDYFLSIDLYFTSSRTEKSYEQFFHYISRLEQLLFNNRNHDTSSENDWFDGTIDSVNVDSGLSTDEMIRTATINFSCRYGKV